MGWINTASDSANIVTSERRYSQCLVSELVPTLFVDGKPVSWRRQVVILNTSETVTEKRGLTKSAVDALLANDTNWQNAVTVQGTGSGTWESFSRTVEARLANPAAGWTVEKVEKSSSIAVSS